MFADAEALMPAFLGPVVDVRVVSTVPSPRPDEFVQAWRSGGAASNRVREVVHITVTAWAKSKPRASELARIAQDAFFNQSTRLKLLRGVQEVSGVYYDPDPDSGAPRYTFTVALTMRAAR